VFNGVSNNVPINGTFDSFFVMTPAPFATPGIIGPTMWGTIDVNEPTSVPDGDSFLPLSLGSLGVMGLACWWRKKEQLLQSL
jgi:hypothetical protein